MTGIGSDRTHEVYAPYQDEVTTVSPNINPIDNYDRTRPRAVSKGSAALPT